ncbi:hypothetical protein Tco_1291607 [Tanacetum coccineum]
MGLFAIRETEPSGGIAGSDDDGGGRTSVVGEYEFAVEEQPISPVDSPNVWSGDADGEDEMRMWRIGVRRQEEVVWRSLSYRLNSTMLTSGPDFIIPATRGSEETRLRLCQGEAPQGASDPSMIMCMPTDDHSQALPGTATSAEEYSHFRHYHQHSPESISVMTARGGRRWRGEAGKGMSDMSAELLHAEAAEED